MYKVLIPSAGLGTRLGDLGKNINKALVSVAHKPVISHVIEKFPKDVEIVVALGHKADLLKDYLQIAHPERKITCVEIDHYYGSKSGLGYTILQCEQHLQCPFVFTPNDTLVLEDIPTPYENWMAFADVENTDQYRSIDIDKQNMVCKVYEKDEGIDVLPYIGLAGIKDYKSFWNYMKGGVDKGSILIGESFAFREMIKSGSKVRSKKFTWYDTGNVKNLKVARKVFEKQNSPNILEKPNEAIWFVNGLVIKYHNDVNFITGRVERSKVLSGYVPDIVNHKDNMYSYKLISGQPVAKITNEPVFNSLLEYLQTFWQPVELSDTEKEQFVSVCDQFYRVKTLERVKLYFNKTGELDTAENINGIDIPSLSEMLDKLPWERVINGDPHRMHGDLHFENILMSQTGEFCLLDWRQNFGGLKKYGDIYYDLAKLLHGLIVSHEIVSKECYSVDQVANIISYDLHRKNSLVNNEKQFYDFLIDNNLDVFKVELLTALIFLNIAPLHHYPYSKMLFYLGKENLYKLLRDYNVVS